MREYPVSTSIHLTRDPDYIVPLDHQIKRIIDAGFRYLDFNFLDHYYSPASPFTTDKWRSWIGVARETADKRGAVFNQAHAPCPVFNCEKDMPLLREYCRRSFIGCKDLGIPWMVFHHIGNPKNFGSDLTKFEFDKLFFSWMLEDAHKYGVGIAIENLFQGGEVGGVRLNPVDYVIALSDELNDPLVGVCCDVGHCHIKKYNLIGTPTDTIDVGENLKRIGHRLRATHIHDNISLEDDHIPPFMGDIDWKGVMRALDEIDYKHSFTFEAHYTVSRMNRNGLDETVTDTAIHLLWQIGDAIVHINR